MSDDFFFFFLVKFLVHVLTSLQAVASLPLHHVSTILLINRRELLSVMFLCFLSVFSPPPPSPEGFFRLLCASSVGAVLKEFLQQAEELCKKLASELN